MRAQIRGAIRRERVGRAVRARKSVRRESFDLGKNRRREILREPVLHRALDEALALLLHRGFVLLAHRGAQNIRLLERVSGDRLRRAHHVLLVHDDAVGVLQHRLQERMIVFDLLAAVLAIDEMLHHRLAVLDRVERSGTKERDGRNDVLEARWLEVGEEAAHPRAFHLEHADGVAAREQAIRVGIIEARGD